ncbi:MAG: DUF4019 domain-containing protein [Sphingomonadales bacterium]|nr:DUF4019 domain-containing protein [Sphingomonadales bacterium]MBD3775175.1 DUF4019 domain-containing protein [Paracoccaceae bacterium]
MRSAEIEEFGRMRKVLPLVVAIAVGLSGCNAAQSVDDAQAEVSVFHSELNDGDFAAIWREADEQMHSSASREKFDRFLGAVHTKLGRAGASKQAGWRVNATPGGTFVILNMETQFERGKGTETFTFRRSGDDIKLVGYYIVSDELIMN